MNKKVVLKLEATVAIAGLKKGTKAFKLVMKDLKKHYMSLPSKDRGKFFLEGRSKKDQS